MPRDLCAEHVTLLTALQLVLSGPASENLGEPHQQRIRTSSCPPHMAGTYSCHIRLVRACVSSPKSTIREGYRRRWEQPTETGTREAIQDRPANLSGRRALTRFGDAEVRALFSCMVTNVGSASRFRAFHHVFLAAQRNSQRSRQVRRLRR